MPGTMKASARKRPRIASDAPVEFELISCPTLPGGRIKLFPIAGRDRPVPFAGVEVSKYQMMK